MTTEMQIFVTVDEILGIRFECRGCNSKFPIPLSAEAKFLDVLAGQQIECPHCPEIWFQGAHDERLIALKKFMRAIRDLTQTKMGAELMIELKSSSGRGVSRDSGGGT